PERARPADTRCRFPEPVQVPVHSVQPIVSVGSPLPDPPDNPETRRRCDAWPELPPEGCGSPHRARTIYSITDAPAGTAVPPRLWRDRRLPIRRPGPSVQAQLRRRATETCARTSGCRTTHYLSSPARDGAREKLANRR